MKVFASTKGINREEWLNLRTKGIGGSDVSIIAGLNPYNSVFQLWMEKTGMMKVLEDTENEYTHFGNVLEPVVRSEFTRRTGMEVKEHHCIYQHSQFPYMLANLDGTVVDNGEECIFEAKTASAYKEKQWHDSIPQEYLLQIQHYMAVTNMRKTYIAVLIGGNHFIYHIVERDEELIQLIIDLEKSFWNNNVLGMIQPVPDGSEATSNYLNEKYQSSSTTSIILPEEARNLMLSYDNIKEELKILNERKNEISNRLKDMLKENEKGIIDDRIIKWIPIQKQSFDQKRFEKEQNNLFEQYSTKTLYRRFTVA